MQIIVIVVKRLVMALCLMYAFDLITSSVGVMVPINVVSIIFVTLLGIPALIGLVVMNQLL
ncbi:MAG: pro-sigmaK processing inhibitor BofA family protein [Tenericutes bacterium]|nr:pro-sigmaK processing inhibitor BofA family protein [Mycoplasmatota bacterium]